MEATSLRQLKCDRPQNPGHVSISTGLAEVIDKAYRTTRSRKMMPDANTLTRDHQSKCVCQNRGSLFFKFAL